MAAPNLAYAYPDGQTSACTGCHSGGGGTTTVSVIGPATIYTGQTVSLTIRVTNSSQNGAGFWLELTGDGKSFGRS